MRIDNIADLIADTLAQTGVKRIYGVVGDSLNGLTEALRKRGTIDWLHVRHEEVRRSPPLPNPRSPAISRCARAPAVRAICTSSTGCSTPIAAARRCWRWRRRSPRAEIGGGYFQETHPQDLFRECSHYCELVSDPEQLPCMLENAIRAAVGKRGVAVVVMPGDVALQTGAEA